MQWKCKKFDFTSLLDFIYFYIITFLLFTDFTYI